MNGSEAMVHTLLAGEIDLCFANPGTSEMHFVSALDRAPKMRCVLGLFEGVVTGAADGYYRMAEKPAATLLHLGPGLGNGLANIHNAKRANSGMVNIIGQHALDHIHNDAPLNSDVEAVARPMSHWVKTTKSATAAPMDTAEAISQARSTPGRIASLVLPANCAWEQSDPGQYSSAPAQTEAAPLADSVLRIAKLLNDPAIAKQTTLLLGGRALRAKAATLAGKIAGKTGCQLASEPRNPRMERGRGRVNINPLPFPVAGAVEVLKDTKHLVLIGAAPPVAFFAYPDKPRMIKQPDCEVHTLATLTHDLTGTLQALCDALEANNCSPAYFAPQSKLVTELPTGAANADNIGFVIAATLPENAILIDEAVTTGRQLFKTMPMATPHDCLDITGGSIGFGLPCAVGAAVACPDRKVVALVGDGSAMYTIQALWTMARESLDITVVICANRTYRILRGELANMGGPAPGISAARMLDLDQPNLDFVAIAKGHGVPGIQVNNLEDLAKALRVAAQEKGPKLIELVM
jgi:acetolactate synthase-1/2/3 large subunit